MSNQDPPPEPRQGYDLIGDVHGHADELERLLARLGYRRAEDAESTAWVHETRTVVFLGDLIDRGPKIRETLQLVHAMVTAGSAHVVLGNHEYNAVCYHTPDGNGGYLRPRTESKVRQHKKTVEAFAGHDADWRDSLAWFRTLPFFLELDGLRAVHAAWVPAHIELLRDASLEDEAFLHASARKGTPQHAAIEAVLKGPEVELPDGLMLPIKNGGLRAEIRVRWWVDPTGKTCRELVFPSNDDVPDKPYAGPVDAEAYPEDAPPVCFGHYWMKPGDPPSVLHGKLACLDHSAGKGGPLVAYRWSGERELSDKNFVSSREH